MNSITVSSIISAWGLESTSVATVPNLYASLQCSCSCSASHQISLIKLKFNDKIIKNFKTATVKLIINQGALLRKRQGNLHDCTGLRPMKLALDLGSRMQSELLSLWLRSFETTDMPGYIDDKSKVKRPIPSDLPNVKGKESRGWFEPPWSKDLLRSAHSVRAGVRLLPESP